jgi:hypothetical protein
LHTQNTQHRWLRLQKTGIQKQTVNTRGQTMLGNADQTAIHGATGDNARIILKFNILEINNPAYFVRAFFQKEVAFFLCCDVPQGGGRGHKGEALTARPSAMALRGRSLGGRT